MNQSLSVLLPLYNAEQIVEPLLLEAIEVLPDFKGGFDIVVIDDGSLDDTTGIATGIAARFPQIRVVRNARRLGPQAAARSGLAVGSGELILWRDEASTNGIRGIHRLARMLAGYDMACGRIATREPVRTPKSDVIPRRDGVVGTVGMAVEQSMPELYLTRREVLQGMDWPMPDRMSLEQELNMRGFRWIETPLPAQAGRSQHLPGMDPMFRQLAEQSQRVADMFTSNTDIHGVEDRRGPNFLGKLKQFAIGE